MIFVPLYEGEKGTSFDRYYPSMIVFEMEMRNDDASMRFGNTAFSASGVTCKFIPIQNLFPCAEKKKRAAALS